MLKSSRPLANRMGGKSQFLVEKKDYFVGIPSSCDHLSATKYPNLSSLGAILSQKYNLGNARRLYLVDIGPIGCYKNNNFSLENRMKMSIFRPVVTICPQQNVPI